MFIFTIVDLSRAAYYYSVVFNSAREGARFAVARPNVSYGDVITATENLAGGLDLVVTVNSDDDQVEVDVRYTFVPATPVLWDLVGDGNIQLRSKATMQIEQ